MTSETALTLLLSSTLVLEIYRNIRDGIKASKAKKNAQKQTNAALPEQVNTIAETLSQMKDDNEKRFSSIDKALKENDKQGKQRDKAINKLEEALQKNAHGTALGLKNDLVIFDALRTHHINGQSEIAENEVKAYLVANMEENYSA